MKAVLITQAGGPEVMEIGEIPLPEMGPTDLLVKVKATALNRADLMQREGRYPPPPGASPILGLEMAGIVEAVGTKVSEWKLGDEVMGLLSGGGYAEYAVIPASMAMAKPVGWSWEQAAAIPEVYLTAFQALDWIGKLKSGETLLLHAGASGVGTAAIQIAREKGAKVFVTASAPKHALCQELGASLTIDYRAEDFAEVIEEKTQGKGVDVIVDFLAAPYFQRNLSALGVDGRLVMLSLMGGGKLEGANLVPILRKRLSILGSTLRSRSLAYKIRLTKDLETFAGIRWADGSLKPVVDSVFPLAEVQDAHRYMGENRNQGKIILKMP